MIEQEILNFNKKCAKYIGGKTHLTALSSIARRMKSDQWWLPYFGIVSHYHMKFHSDWNWIHFVIDAIEKKGYQIDFGSRLVPDSLTKDSWCTIWTDDHNNKIVESHGETKKEAVVQAVNQYLDWYNLNNN